MHWQTRLWRIASYGLPLLAPFVLKRRLRDDKEDAERWREKLGEPSQLRPLGRLIWLHAVSLGEVMALRGLIATMHRADPTASFLLTSSTKASAEVIERQMPPRTFHQYLPLDAPRYLDKFLKHWRPDLSIWSEQDLWPNAILATDRANVPLAMVNARMHAPSFRKRQKLAGLYGDLLSRFQLIAAQDVETAHHLAALGAKGVEVTGALKAASPALSAPQEDLDQLTEALEGRKPWLVASAHPEDDEIVLQAAKRLYESDPSRLLIFAPRQPKRAPMVRVRANALGLSVAMRSKGDDPRKAAVFLTDSFGEMGLWYRLAPVTLIGGSFGPVEGHNPWEPAALGSAILHGPRIANFPADFAQLHAAGAAVSITPETLVSAIEDEATQVHCAEAALALTKAARQGLPPLARRLLAMIRPQRG